MGSPLAPFREGLASAVARSQGLSADETRDLVASIREPEPEHGDLALPCFQLAKKSRRRPDQVASELEDQLRGSAESSAWQTLRAVGPTSTCASTPERSRRPSSKRRSRSATARETRGRGRRWSSITRPRTSQSPSAFITFEAPR
ncbi:MAG: hypothetical protein HC923_10260 [Myxococcales bacterium]|nr:hypothetical protein [Myxococcales bacterium]